MGGTACFLAVTTGLAARLGAEIRHLGLQGGEFGAQNGAVGGHEDWLVRSFPEERACSAVAERRSWVAGTLMVLFLLHALFLLIS